MATPFTVQAVGSVGTGTTPVNVPYPAPGGGILAGDVLVVVMVSKYPSNVPTIPSGWSTATINWKQGGHGSSGTNKGAIQTNVFYKTAAGGESGNLAVTVTGDNVAEGVMLCIRGSSGAGYSVDGAAGARNIVSSPWSVTSPATIDLLVADLVVAGSGINGNAYSYSAEAMSQTSTTFANETEQVDQGTATGDHAALAVSTHEVSTGGSVATVGFTMTPSGGATDSPAGATVFLRLRETRTATGSAAMKKFSGSGVAVEVFTSSGSAAQQKFAGSGVAVEVFTSTGSAAMQKFGASGAAIETFVASGTAAAKKFAGSGTATEVFVASGSAAAKKFAGSGTSLEVFLANGTGAAKKFGAVGVAVETFVASGSSAMQKYGAGSVDVEVFVASGVGVMAKFSAQAVAATVDKASGSAAMQKFAGRGQASEVFVSSHHATLGGGVGLKNSLASSRAEMQFIGNAPSVRGAPFHGSSTGATVFVASGHGAAKKMQVASVAKEVFVCLGHGVMAKFAGSGRAIQPWLLTYLRLGLLGRTAAGNRVYTNRGEAWADSELPAIAIYTRREETRISTESPREYERDQTVVFELLVEADAQRKGDDTLDDFCDAVLELLVEDEYAQGNAARSWYVGTTIAFAQPGPAHDVLCAKIEMTYRLYLLVEETPDTASPLGEVDDQWQFAGFAPGDPPRAVDRIVLPGP